MKPPPIDEQGHIVPSLPPAGFRRVPLKTVPVCGPTILTSGIGGENKSCYKCSGRSSKIGKHNPCLCRELYGICGNKIPVFNDPFKHSYLGVLRKFLLTCWDYDMIHITSNLSKQYWYFA